MKFRDWLASELERRDWNAAELAKRADLEPSTISRILANKKSLGVEAAQKIAAALGESPERIFILAGLLPSPPDDDDPIIKDIHYLVKQLPSTERKDVLDYIRYKVNRPVSMVA